MQLCEASLYLDDEVSARGCRQREPLNVRPRVVCFLSKAMSDERLFVDQYKEELALHPFLDLLGRFARDCACRAVAEREGNDEVCRVGGLVVSPQLTIGAFVFHALEFMSVHWQVVSVNKAKWIEF